MTDNPTTRHTIPPEEQTDADAIRRSLGLGPQPVLLRVHPAVARDLLTQLAGQLGEDAKEP